MQLSFTELGASDSDMPAMAPFAMRNEGLVYNRGTTRGSGVLESGRPPSAAPSPHAAPPPPAPRQAQQQHQPPRQAPSLDPRLEHPRLEHPRLGPRVEQRPEASCPACPTCQQPASCPPHDCPPCATREPCPQAPSPAPCAIPERAPIWLMYALLLANAVTLVMCIIMLARRR